MIRSILGACALATLLTGCPRRRTRAAVVRVGHAGRRRRDLGPEVTGSGCNTAILWLIAWGDGGYDAAVRDAKSAVNAPFLVDVKADTTYTNVLLGVYQHQCTKVTGRVPGLTSPPPAPGGKAP